MEKRVFAVLDNDVELRGVASKLASVLAGYFPDAQIYVARPTGSTDGEAPANAKLLLWPNELATDGAIRNWLNQSEAAKQAKFFHVVSGSTELLKDPNEFVGQLEATMAALDYSFWLSTSCDPCNYLYSKFCSRVVVEVDDPKYAKLGLPQQLLLTSHSNLQWVAYDMEKASGSELRFDEDFSITMYEIIEALARRRAGKTSQPYFMNQYVTVPAEAGTFRVSSLAKQPVPSQETMQREDAAFKAKNVNYAADNAVDEVMAALKTKLDEKAA